MNTAIIVDDEPLAINQLKKIIEADGRLKLVATFCEAEAALTYCEDHQVSFVFSDIQMPEMDGITFGKRLNVLNPKAKPIYVTAYGEYSFEAFQNYAVGYLLKPITKGQLGDLLNRFIDPHIQKPLVAKTLGTTNLLYDGQVIKFRTAKAQELFFYLLAYGPQMVSVDKIIEDLWPKETYTFAKKQLNNSLYGLRNALKPYNYEKSVLYKSAAYGLDIRQVEWDYVAIMALLKNHIKSYVSMETFRDIEAINKGQCFEGSDYLWSYVFQTNLDIALDQYYHYQARNPIFQQGDARVLSRLLEKKVALYSK